MKLLVGLALGYASFLASQTLTLATPLEATTYSMATLSQKVYFNPPPPPKEPPPGGRVIGGATRGSCPQVKQNLTALVPFTQEPPSVTNVWSLTTAAHPTFWFYVPYSQNVTSPAMFVLQDENANPIYEKAIAPPTKPGVMSVSLPADAPKLAVNQQYRWFLSFSCDSEKQSPPIYVEGVVKRVNLSQEITKQLQTATPQQQFAIYAQNGIWHEALTTLAKLRQKNPQDSALKTQWQDLLVSIHLGDVATEPMVLDKP